MSPILGALADATGRKKRLLAVFAGIGIVATAGLGLIGRGDWLLAARRCSCSATSASTAR